MKKIIQKSLVIALLYYAVALVGCIQEKVCPPLKNQKFQYKSLTVENLEYTFYGDDYSDTAFEKKPLIIDTVDRLNYGIRLRFDYGSVANSRKASQFNIMNAAYAKDISCITDEYFTSVDTIKKLSIITLQDFDSRFPKGSDATKAFILIHKNSTIKYVILNSVDEADGLLLRSAEQSGTIDLDIFLGNTYSYVSKLVAFEIRLEYTNGKIFTAKTKPVFLK